MSDGEFRKIKRGLEEAKASTEVSGKAGQFGIPWRAEVCSLLRAARHCTQTEVAAVLRVPTSAVSRIERRQDCRISTLQRSVAALGGRLEMWAVFPDDAVDLNTLMDTSTRKQEAN